MPRQTCLVYNSSIYLALSLFLGVWIASGKTASARDTVRRCRVGFASSSCWWWPTIFSCLGDRFLTIFFIFFFILGFGVNFSRFFSRQLYYFDDRTRCARACAPLCGLLCSCWILGHWLCDPTFFLKQRYFPIVYLVVCLMLFSISWWNLHFPTCILAILLNRWLVGTFNAIFHFDSCPNSWVFLSSIRYGKWADSCHVLENRLWREQLTALRMMSVRLWRAVDFFFVVSSRRNVFYSTRRDSLLFSLSSLFYRVTMCPGLRVDASSVMTVFFSPFPMQIIVSLVVIVFLLALLDFLNFYSCNKSDSYSLL